MYLCIGWDEENIRKTVPTHRIPGAPSNLEVLGYPTLNFKKKSKSLNFFIIKVLLMLKKQ